jgi:plastocyanin
MTLSRSTPLLLLAAALTLTGCKPDAATHTGESLDKATGPGVRTTSAPTTVPVDPATAGSVSGTIHFKGTAPKPLKIDMSMDPGCAMAGDNNTEQYVVSGGKLANVYVYIKSGVAPSTVSGSDTPVVLDQKGCRYVPHVIAVQQGGSVLFKNSDPTMHNIHIVGPNGGAMDISQGPMGQPQTQQFSSPQVMLPVRCNNHPWMNAFINVAPSPYFAVTGTDGSFTIQGLPPGNYTLAAVHEKLGEQDIAIIVKPKSTAKADFSFSAN